MTRTRILIADDHPLVRSGMRALLQTAPNLEIVGEAGSGEEVVTLAAAAQPDVILMDLRMPGMSGIEATRRILAANPQIRILVVTLVADDESVFAALRAGARGYILKDASEGEMLQAIQMARIGDAVFSAPIAQRLIDFFAAPTAPTPPALFPDLTEREREILTLIARGRNNAEIANMLVISMKTVRNYISSIFSKLQVTDRAQAIVQAREAGLVGEGVAAGSRDQHTP